MHRRFLRSVRRMRSGQRFALILLLALSGAVDFASVTPSSVFAEPVKHAAQQQTAATHRLPDGLYAALAQVGPYMQQAKLTASDGVPYDHFGSSVALSSDGGTALVGVPDKTVNGLEGQGAAYVFVRSGATWTRQAELTASDSAAYDRFGESLALSSDGRTALVGAPAKTMNDYEWQGATYVFARNGATWRQQAELTASDGAGDAFGGSVALSGDGSTALIGAKDKTVNGNGEQGMVYMFTGSGVTWVQQAELTASDGARDDQFGGSLTLSNDGSTVLVGADGKTVNGQFQQGVAYVFTGSGTSWTQQAELTASNGAAGDQFGVSVALSNGTALVGAWQKTVNGQSAQGAAYVFARNGPSWAQRAELIASDGVVNDSLGNSVMLSSSGSTALVGAPVKTVNDNLAQGAAYVFTRSGASWVQQAELTTSDGAAGDQFGNSVTLSTDDSTALVGAVNNTVNGQNHQGAAYVFVASGGK